MVKTASFQCKWCRFDPCSGNEDPTCHVAWLKKKIYLKIRVTLKINKIHKKEPVQTIPSSRIASLHAFLQRPLAVWSGEL